jgi:hypothetical protein
MITGVSWIVSRDQNQHFNLRAGTPPSTHEYQAQCDEPASELAIYRSAAPEIPKWPRLASAPTRPGAPAGTGLAFGRTV